MLPATPRPPSIAHAERADTLSIPLALALGSLALYLFTRTEFHTFDGVAYMRDMGKPLAALVLPHHLVYEPLVLGFYKLWQALGWRGQADVPAQLLSSLAGAGGLALFYKSGWDLSRSRAATLLATFALGLSYGYWFYSVEVDIYLPPLFFLLLATWLLLRAIRDGGPAWRFYLVGLAHGGAVLFHQVALLIAPAFALGIWLLQGNTRARLLRVTRYGAALGGLVGPAYLFAGMVVAGQNTPEAFIAWVNSYGNLGTWGGLRADTAQNLVSGLSAALSNDFWVGRVLLVALLLAVIAAAFRGATRRGGAFAWTLWVWMVTYLLFFTWWQPEVLKFWVLMLPALLLLILASVPGEGFLRRARNASLAAGLLAVLALVGTNAPEIWAKREPMSDPARRVSDALSRLTRPEDLIVLQASGAEHYLPFMYDRINVMSMRELWYTLGGAEGRERALGELKSRAWHALAKGSSVWIEDRVLAPGEQSGDRYVFTRSEVVRLLDLYGEPANPQPVEAGPSRFYRLSPGEVVDERSAWRFTEDAAGWSGVNIAGESSSGAGWCSSPLDDPNLYGPPLRFESRRYGRLEITMASEIAGRAQLFFRGDYATPYAEENSVAFSLEVGEATYSVELAGVPGWEGFITGLRLDPLEGGDGREVCIREIRLTP